MARVVITGGAGFLGPASCSIASCVMSRYDQRRWSRSTRFVVDRVILTVCPPDLEVIQGDLLTLIQTEPDIFEQAML